MNKEKKHIPTYSERHNKAVRIYQKASFFLLWAGVVNVIAAIFGVFGVGTTTDSEGNIVDYRYSMCFSINKFLNYYLEQSGLDQWLFSLIIVFLALAMGGLFALFGYLASSGKRLYLFAGAILYVLDFVLFFFAFYNSPWTSYAFGLATHAVILVAIGVAIFEYFNVLSIEAHYRINNAGEKHE